MTFIRQSTNPGIDNLLSKEWHCKSEDSRAELIRLVKLQNRFKQNKRKKKAKTILKHSKILLHVAAIGVHEQTTALKSHNRSSAPL